MEDWVYNFRISARKILIGFKGLQGAISLDLKEIFIGTWFHHCLHFGKHVYKKNLNSRNNPNNCSKYRNPGMNVMLSRLSFIKTLIAKVALCVLGKGDSSLMLSRTMSPHYCIVGRMKDYQERSLMSIKTPLRHLHLFSRCLGLHPDSGLDSTFLLMHSGR